MEPETTSLVKPDLFCSIEISSSINKLVLEQANEIIQNSGFDTRQTSGTGTVRVTRLLEGVYPTDESRKRLKDLKKTVEAFVMPEGGKLAIYVGSFHKPEKAIRYAELLAEKKIEVPPLVKVIVP